jgi:hypothetical protein
MGHDYGEIWDAEQIYGCVCNPGFGGYDCSECKQKFRTSLPPIGTRLHCATVPMISIDKCPHGDDPLTTGQFTEIKILQCSTDDSDPTFKIKYQREEFTARGDWTVSDWEAAFNVIQACFWSDCMQDYHSFNIPPPFTAGHASSYDGSGHIFR